MKDAAGNVRDGLPKGLSIRRKGEGLETVTTKAGEIRLLASRRGTEVVEGVLSAAERMTLVPSAHAAEAYYLLEGSLQASASSAPFRLEPGDYLVTEALLEPLSLAAESDVRFLYVTTHPTFHEISQHLSELMRLSVEVEQKDGYTADHCRRLQKLSYATGLELGLSPSQLYLLDYGAYLHDIGKVRVPAHILRKPAALTPAEWKIIKLHPIYGKEMLESTFMKEVGVVVEQHHERLDGSGYPYGLKGDEISLEASIVAVVDSYDAMTTDRPYRQASSHDEAMSELSREAGRLYRRDVVEAFFLALKKLN